MRDNFINRGYNRSLVLDQIEKANKKSRNDTLAYKTHKTKRHIPLTTMFNPTLSQISNILKYNSNILRIKPEVRECFSKTLITSYRRNKNLRDMIGSNKVINKKVRRNFKLNKHQSIKFCKPCNTKECLCCNQLKHSSQFQVQRPTENVKFFLKLTVKVNLSFIYLSASNVNYKLHWKIRMAIQHAP